MTEIIFLIVAAVAVTVAILGSDVLKLRKDVDDIKNRKK